MILTGPGAVRGAAMSTLLCMARRIVRNPSTPRQFPTTGFEVITNLHLVEEEQWEWYKPEEFYPVRIGEIFKSQYQVVGKLGYGAYATAWLCRDLQCATITFPSLAHDSLTLPVTTNT